MRLRHAHVKRRGMGPFREMHQLGSTVGDGWRRRGRADGWRRGRAPSREMHQLGKPVGD